MDNILRGIQESSKKQELLELLLRDEGFKEEESQIICMRDWSEGAPLSYAQERMWFLEHLTPGTSVNHIPSVFRLKFTVDPKGLYQSLRMIVRRHHILRTSFRMIGGTLLQFVSPSTDFDYRESCIDRLPPHDREIETLRLIDVTTRRPFNLATGPLFRAHLIRVSMDEYVVILVSHHIVADGMSLELLRGELSTLYKGAVKGRLPKLNELPIQYADYAAWQRGWIETSEAEEQLHYWVRRLTGVPTLELPLDFPRPRLQTFRGARTAKVLDKEEAETVRQFAKDTGATLFMVLLAAVMAVLWRLSRPVGLSIGTPVAGRTRSEVKDLIGMFLNTIVVTANMGDDPNFGTLTRRVRTAAIEAYSHQDIPFERVLEVLQPQRDATRTPVFQVFYNHLNFGDMRLVEEEDLSGPPKTAHARFDLTLYTSESSGEFHFLLIHNRDLFEDTTARQILDDVVQVLVQGAAHPNVPVSLIPQGVISGALPPPSSIRSVTASSNSVKEAMIADRFESIVRTHGSRVAVQGAREQLTYTELDEVTETLTRTIVQTKAASETSIALLFGHNSAAVVGLLAASKARMSWVPLDPRHPQKRLQLILSDSRSKVILTCKRFMNLARSIASVETTIIDVDAILEVPDDSKVSPRELTYLLYTSGSTGHPKGVIQSEEHLLHHVDVYRESIDICADDTLSVFSNYSVDAGLTDIFAGLLSGATLFIHDLRSDGIVDIARLLTRNCVSVLHATPTLFRAITGTIRSGEVLRGVRVVVLGGEAAYRSDFEAFRRCFEVGCTFVNGYGHTESTTALQFFADHNSVIEGHVVPIGFPVVGMDVEVVGESGEEVEVGSEGEIVLRSLHLALTYSNDTKLASQVFRPISSPGARCYWTGDLGKKKSDGTILFTGRKKHHIKIRGYRVDARGVEAVLLEESAIDTVAVLARPDAQGESRLVAYLSNSSGQRMGRGELERRLKAILPDYEIPEFFIWLDELPQLASGKVDRAALELCPWVGSAEPQDYEAPTNDWEKTLATIWEDLFQMKPIGRNARFFYDLGGHSLLAMQMISRASAALGMVIPVRLVFETPTLGALAHSIEVLSDRASNRLNSTIPWQPRRPRIIRLSEMGELETKDN